MFKERRGVECKDSGVLDLSVVAFFFPPRQSDGVCRSNGTHNASFRGYLQNLMLRYCLEKSQGCASFTGTSVMSPQAQVPNMASRHTFEQYLESEPSILSPKRPDRR